MKLRALIVFCLLAFGGAPALADVIHLSSGGVVRGKIIKETSRRVVVQTLGGETVVPRGDIERIVRGASPEEAHRSRLKKIDKRDPDARYKLGKWLLRKHNARELARREFKRAIELAPDHAKAREALGFVRKAGEWVKTSAAEASSGARSKVKKRRKNARLTVPASSRLQEALAAIRSKNPEKRAAAWAVLADASAEVERLNATLSGEPDRDQAKLRAFLAKANPATSGLAADALTEQVQAYVQETQRPAITEAVQLYARAVVRKHGWVDRRFASFLKDYTPGKAHEKRSEALAKWAEARDAALAVIFDLQIYPDANHGRSGQPTVDEHVEKVRVAWATFDKLVRKDVSKVLALSEAESKALLAKLADIYVRLGEINVCIEARGVEATPLPKTAPIYWALVAYRAGDISGALSALPQLGPWEQELVRRLRDERVREYNASFKKKSPCSYGVDPSGQEVEQVRITNDYRILMGRAALEIDPRLVQSARGHSAEMTRLGYFDHMSPVPSQRTPSQRMAQAGYPGTGGENISLGSVTAKATHIAWYNSSGHHRNILTERYQAQGSGQDGQHWTQNFGATGTLIR